MDSRSPPKGSPAPGELIFVTLAPDRTIDTTSTKRFQHLQVTDQTDWKGLLIDHVGKPLGIKDKRTADSNALRLLEERWQELLLDLSQDPDPRPRLLKFLPVKENLFVKDAPPRGGIQTHELLYRTYKTEGRLVRSILEHSGFASTESHDWNVLWLGGSPKPYLFEGLLEHQRINHFPNSTEITRKDRLCVNVTEMQNKYGKGEFNFLPETFVLPDEFNDFLATFHLERAIWILKPSASSQGKGIYLIENVGDVPIDESCVVSRYISNPLLVNGLKFDMRLYVLVSCYEPLRIYIYEEGLARFACEPYVLSSGKYSKFMHLTNYSVNKKCDGFVQNEDFRRDDVGHKWSVSALMKHLESLGADTSVIWVRIYDLVIKTILSIEQQVVDTVHKLALYRGNCFDLFGFDVLLDENLKPWLLEVNLSPSLGTDSPLDLFVKANLIADTLNLVGVRAFDRRKDALNKVRARLRIRQQISKKTTSLPPTAVPPRAASPLPRKTINTAQRLREMLRETLEENDRRGHFLRIYPVQGCDCYDRFFESPRNSNKSLYRALFGEGEYDEGELDQSNVSQSGFGTSQTMPSPTVTSHSREKSKNSSFIVEKHFLPDIDNARETRRSEEDMKKCGVALVAEAQIMTPPKEGKLVITGDDVLVEYLVKTISILKSIKEESLKPQWRRCLEKFVSHSIWRTLDFRRGDAVHLWQRLEVKIGELKGRRQRYYEVGLKTKDGDRREEQRQQIVKSFTPGQLEAMLKAAQKNIAQELIGCLFDGEGKGVLSDLTQWWEESLRSQTTLQQLGEGEEEEVQSTFSR